MALPFFAATLFVSAALLFLIQPMIGKMILPNLGGTPQVWNTCMVFFQAALLVGYGYTHVISTRLKVRAQLIVHSIALFVPVVLIVFGTMYYAGAQTDPDKGMLSFFYAAKQGLRPIGGGTFSAIFQALGWLAMTVGLPFMVVATSAPLLQRWFGHTGHPEGKDPYFLYAASNIGSFAGLWAYPLILERSLLLNQQSWTWIIGYGVLLVLVLGCAVMVWKAPPAVRLPGKEEEGEEKLKQEPEPEQEQELEKETGVKAGPPPKEKAPTSFKKGSKQRRKKKKGQGIARDKDRDREMETVRAAPKIAKPKAAAEEERLKPVTPLRRLRWVALAAVPSSLMLGVTTHVTTDLSPNPLIWIIPLSLYLLSFVLVFSRWPVLWVGIPHTVFVIAQPFAIALLILTLIPGLFGHEHIVFVASVHFLAFFVSTMVCHGELAKDRPSTESLTEFYLLMSVGGVLGGMFNALFAPVFFKLVIEYGLAIFFSGLLRPILIPEGLIERLFNLATDGDGSGRRTSQMLRSDAAAPAAPYLRDLGFALGALVLIGLVLVTCRAIFAPSTAQLLGYGLGLSLTFLLMARPLRYAFVIGAILFINGYSATFMQDDSSSRVVWRDRSYFGIITVRESNQGVEGKAHKSTSLTHGTTHHGMNLRKPKNVKNWYKPDKDFSRLATTYYHRLGPAGRVMELYNWYKDPDSNNTFKADNRMPASLVGFAASPLLFGNVPNGILADLWSEPPFATIGLGTGTMASYARPFQHMHYYEIDYSILRLSVPPRKSGQTYNPDNPKGHQLSDANYKKYLRDIGLGNAGATYFTYLADARHRGAEIWVFMGDARLRMDMDYDDSENFKKSADFKRQWNNAYSIRVIDGPKCGGPENFYHMMVVDAFSSDAIPVHLITKEAIKMYFEKLTEDGILCVHTSNRHVDLVRVVADVANSLGLQSRRGHDSAPTKGGVWDVGHFTSEWVMVARDAKYLDKLTAPPNYADDLEAYYIKKYNRPPPPSELEYWQDTTIYDRYVWTDDYSNLMAVFRHSLPFMPALD